MPALSKYLHEFSLSLSCTSFSSLFCVLTVYVSVYVMNKDV